jgi:hypothetical protein
MSTYRDYMEFELVMTLDQVEILAMRDPQMTQDESLKELGGTSAQFPRAQESTGTPEGDQRRWLREHDGADADAPMQVKVMDVSIGGKPQSGWLTLDAVSDFIAAGRPVQR